jgi:hypothetical protein
VKVIVAKAIGGQRINVGRVDEAAEGAVLSKAHVIEIDDEDIGRARFRYSCFGIPLLGFRLGSADLSFELLAVLLERLGILLLRRRRRRHLTGRQRGCRQHYRAQDALESAKFRRKRSVFQHHDSLILSLALMLAS